MPTNDNKRQDDFDPLGAIQAFVDALTESDLENAIIDFTNLGPLPISITSRLPNFAAIYGQEVTVIKASACGKAEMSAINWHLLRGLFTDGEAAVVLDLDPGGGMVPGHDPYFDDWPVKEVLEEKPMKQNGRSAAYLRHDRTKRHGKRR